MSYPAEEEDGDVKKITNGFGFGGGVGVHIYLAKAVSLDFSVNAEGQIGKTITKCSGDGVTEETKVDLKAFQLPVCMGLTAWF